MASVEADLDVLSWSDNPIARVDYTLRKGEDQTLSRIWEELPTDKEMEFGYGFLEYCTGAKMVIGTIDDEQVWLFFPKHMDKIPDHPNGPPGPIYAPIILEATRTRMKRIFKWHTFPMNFKAELPFQMLHTNTDKYEDMCPFYAMVSYYFYISNWCLDGLKWPKWEENFIVALARIRNSPEYQEELALEAANAQEDTLDRKSVWSRDSTGSLSYANLPSNNPSDSDENVQRNVNFPPTAKVAGSPPPPVLSPSAAALASPAVPRLTMREMLKSGMLTRRQGDTPTVNREHSVADSTSSITPTRAVEKWAQKTPSAASTALEDLAHGVPTIQTVHLSNSATPITPADSQLYFDNGSSKDIVPHDRANQKPANPSIDRQLARLTDRYDDQQVQIGRLRREIEAFDITVQVATDVSNEELAWLHDRCHDQQVQLGELRCEVAAVGPTIQAAVQTAFAQQQQQYIHSRDYSSSGSRYTRGIIREPYFAPSWRPRPRVQEPSRRSSSNRYSSTHHPAREATDLVAYSPPWGSDAGHTGDDERSRS